jgi:hypothetical protein
MQYGITDFSIVHVTANPKILKTGGSLVKNFLNYSEVTWQIFTYL